MRKYAFIVMMPDLNPSEYRTSCSAGDNEITFVGVDNMDQAKAVVDELMASGYEKFDLCGSFDESMANEVVDAAKSGAGFSYVTFTGDDWSRFGVLLAADGVDRVHEMELPGEFHSSVRIVGSMDDAIKTAKSLVSEGATFIEMGSWFDDAKSSEIIKAASSEIPMGSAGRNEKRS
ncbi:MAG: DUF6506 family protein [Bacillota bacterium]|nr:DUF6506 family protein [Bacillota bacterium]